MLYLGLQAPISQFSLQTRQPHSSGISHTFNQSLGITGASKLIAGMAVCEILLPAHNSVPSQPVSLSCLLTAFLALRFRALFQPVLCFSLLGSFEPSCRGITLS